jgi:hypothetical protein
VKDLWNVNKFYSILRNKFNNKKCISSKDNQKNNNINNTEEQKRNGLNLHA